VEVPVGQVMAGLGVPAGPDGWAAACNADLGTVLDSLDVLPVTTRSLVIGFGLTPAVSRYLHERDIAYLDVEIHPLRFGSHLCLGVRTNDALVRRALAEVEVDVEYFTLGAARLSARIARNGADHVLTPDARVGLYVGQTAIDLSLVQNGALVTPADVVDQVAEWASDLDVVLLRPHPYAEQPDATLALSERLPNSQTTKLNTYALLTARNLQSVCGISSGALREAPFFTDADVRPLITPDRNNPDYLPPDAAEWLPVTEAIASHAVVAAISSGMPVAPTARPLPRVPDDTIDHILGVTWGRDDAAGLPQPLAVQGEIVRQTVRGDTSQQWLGTGWHDAEDWGVWSTSRARIQVPLRTVASSAGLEVTLEGVQFNAAPDESPSAVIRVAGRGAQATSTGAGTFEWSARLGHDEVATHDELVVDVEVPDAVSPAELGLSDDSRVLGVGLHRIRLTQLPE
jgi:hypothetical protein